MAESAMSESIAITTKEGELFIVPRGIADGSKFLRETIDREADAAVSLDIGVLPFRFALQYLTLSAASPTPFVKMSRVNEFKCSLGCVQLFNLMTI